MIGSVAIDPSTVIVLAAIALTEGIGRVPAGALVLRRTLGGPWRIDAAAAPRDRLRLVHWWPPWTQTLVLPRSRTAGPLDRTALLHRLEVTARIRRLARIVGAVTLLLLVLGIPAAIGSAGSAGGVLAAAGVLAGQVVLGGLGWSGLRALGATRKARWRLAAAALNPFAAPAMASKILAAAVAGAAPLAVAHTVLAPAVWARWFRPRAYDVGVALAPDDEIAQDLEDADDAIAQVLALRPDMANDGLWCPRCAATYQAGFTTCAECGVALLGADERAPLRAAPRSAVPT